LQSKDLSNIKSVSLSECGNFAFIGTEKGRIDKFNIQSGIHRCSFIGHSKQITGIVSNLNSMVISSSLDCQLIFWDFNGVEKFRLKLDAPISQIVLSTESGLLAAVCDDLNIRVIDITTRKIVRIFQGHSNRITSTSFSPDERWIVSASLDGTIRLWDLPTGHMIDAFSTENLPTSVSFSPKGDFIATTHVGKVGIYLWTNRSMYEHVEIKSLKVNEIRQFELPNDQEGLVEGDIQSEENDFDAEKIEKVDIVDEMIKFSDLPASRWMNLLSLEHIKKRNKPIDPPKKPELAPFFLPTIEGATPSFEKLEKIGSRVQNLKGLNLDLESVLHIKLESAIELNSCILNF
jgi:U3 small nucleolar RNA-associated protein 21